MCESAIFYSFQKQWLNLILPRAHFQSCSVFYPQLSQPPPPYFSIFTPAARHSVLSPIPGKPASRALRKPYTPPTPNKKLQVQARSISAK